MELPELIDVFILLNAHPEITESASFITTLKSTDLEDSFDLIKTLCDNLKDMPVDHPLSERESRFLLEML